MEACVGHMDANSQNDWPMLTLPCFVDHILQPLRDPAWPIPILKDFSDVTLVGSDDKQNKAHKIILAWPDRSKKGLLAWRGLSARPGLSACWPVGLLVCWPVGLARPGLSAWQGWLGPANLVPGSYAIMDRAWARRLH
jgi:hypothetical protein